MWASRKSRGLKGVEEVYSVSLGRFEGVVGLVESTSDSEEADIVMMM